MSRPVTERAVLTAQTRHRKTSGNPGGDRWMCPKAKRQRGEPDVLRASSMYVVVLTLCDEGPATVL